MIASNLNCHNIFLIYLAPNGILFCVKLTGKVRLQSRLGIISKDSEMASSQCTNPPLGGIKPRSSPHWEQLHWLSERLASLDIMGEGLP